MPGDLPGGGDLGGGTGTDVSNVHPIEAESYRLVGERVDLSRLGPLESAVVARVVHATADPEYADTMVLDEGAVASGIRAIRAGAPVVTDVEMVRAGIDSARSVCYLREAKAGRERAPTRSAAAMRLAALRHPRGSVVVVGCAPTALEEVVGLVEADALDPALVVGVPVGFVGAAEAKQRARDSRAATITNVGDKGGSAVAAAVVNAVARLAADPGLRA